MSLTIKQRVDLSNMCLKVLKEKGKKGRGEFPRGMMSYQVLDKLPNRDQLLADYGKPGKNSGIYFPASQVVSRALMRLERCGLVNFSYYSSAGIYVLVAGKMVEPGYEVTAFYTLTRRGMEADRIFYNDIRKNYAVFNKAGDELAAYAETPDREEIEE